MGRFKAGQRGEYRVRLSLAHIHGATMGGDRSRGTHNTATDTPECRDERDNMMDCRLPPLFSTLQNRALPAGGEALPQPAGWGARRHGGHFSALDRAGLRSAGGRGQIRFSALFAARMLPPGCRPPAPHPAGSAPSGPGRDTPKEPNLTALPAQGRKFPTLENASRPQADRIQRAFPIWGEERKLHYILGAAFQAG